MPERLNNKLVRITVTEAFKLDKGYLIGDCVNGKIESGTIRDKQKLVILPHNEIITIRGVEVNGEKRDQGKTGDICTIGIKVDAGFDPTLISSGDVICE